MVAVHDTPPPRLECFACGCVLEEKPAIRGIFVPGMPMGSPGMEGPDADKYDVLAVDQAGAVSVFATHGH